VKDYFNLSKEDLLKLIEKQEEELKSKKYGLFWDAEREPEQVVLDCENNLPVLKRVKGKEIRTNKEEDNILIEGDNYHALTVLNYTHKEKIDVIYIDPPYNTGNNDFVYNDRYVDKEDGFRHSKWLNFMEKRLNLAKDLLKETGVIFISIDDNEAAQLKMLCDRILGEENYYGCLTWVKRTKSTNSGKAKKMVQQKIEYVHVYGIKNREEFEGFEMIYSGIEKSYPHEGKLGKCRFENLEATDYGRKKRDTMKFPILGIKPRQGKRWQVGLEEANRLIENDRIEIVGGVPKRVFYPEDEDSESFIPFWSHLEDAKSAEDGKKQLGEIIGFNHGFDTVKPINLLLIILRRFKNNVTVLDFMAGSGTTGHAVLDLNKEDGGNRKFILCTNNELNGLAKELREKGMSEKEIEEYGICRRVTYPRLEKVINGYKNPKGEKVAGLGGNLQYFRTDLIKKAKNKDQVRIDLTQKCTEMLCVKENIFNLSIEDEDYKIFTSNKKDRFLCVYFNFQDDSFEKFLREIKKLSGKKTIYMFSIDGKVDSSLFAGVDDFTIEEIPQKIVDIYRRLVKMNIPIKSDHIFSDFIKAKECVFVKQEKDEGARILRIVIEKVIQKIAQNNGVNILKNNTKEEKLTILNDKLKGENIFSKVDWEENKTYIAIGNHAAHGEYSEYDLKNAENFYQHVQKIIERYNLQ
jgi:adenine-specific DNA-methyltransferase